MSFLFICGFFRKVFDIVKKSLDIYYVFLFFPYAELDYDHEYFFDVCL